MYWKAIDNRRAGFISFARKKVNDALDKDLEQFLSKATNLRSLDTIQNRLDRMFKTDNIRDAITSIYKRVGVAFAQDKFTSLQKSYNTDYEVKQPEEDTRLQTTWQRQVIRYLKENLGEKASGIKNFNKKIVNRVVQKGIEEGWSIEKTAREIEKEWQTINRHRARRIARTETITASNQGAMTGARSTGLDLTKEWISTRDNRTRSRFRGDEFDHLQPDGQKRKMDTPFDVSGQRMNHPGDTSLGATLGNIVNCRCTVGFVRRRFKHQRKAPLLFRSRK